MKNLYLICLLFIISACGTPTTEDRITFTQVDPFLKVFRESNFFPEYDETEEVAAGEHATFQFAVRAALPLKELSAQVTAFTNEKGTQLQSSPRTGFVDYVRVGRQTPDRAKDAITSLSHYYPDPIIEQNGQSVMWRNPSGFPFPFPPMRKPEPIKPHSASKEKWATKPLS